MFKRLFWGLFRLKIWTVKGLFWVDFYALFKGLFGACFYGLLRGCLGSIFMAC